MEDQLFKRRKRGLKRLSGYQLLLRECMQELKRRNPTQCLVLPMVSKLCAERWKTLDKETKSIFQQQADKINAASKGGAGKRQLPKDLLSSTEPKLSQKYNSMAKEYEKDMNDAKDVETAPLTEEGAPEDT